MPSVREATQPWRKVGSGMKQIERIIPYGTVKMAYMEGNVHRDKAMYTASYQLNVDHLQKAFHAALSIVIMTILCI